MIPGSEEEMPRSECAHSSQARRADPSRSLKGCGKTVKIKSNQVRIDRLSLKKSIWKRGGGTEESCMKNTNAPVGTILSKNIKLKLQVTAFLSFFLISSSFLSDPVSSNWHFPVLIFSQIVKRDFYFYFFIFYGADANSRSVYRKTSRTVWSPKPWPFCPLLTSCWHWT